MQPQMPGTNHDPHGGVQISSQNLTGLLAELTRMANIIQAGGLGITQSQIDFITSAIQGTTRPVAAFALTPVQQHANVIIDYGIATRAKLYEKATGTLKHSFDHKKSHTVTF